MGKSKFVLVAAVALAGCKQTREVREHREQAQAKTAEPAASSTLATPSDAGASLQVSAATRSVATFHKDRLDECVDFILVGPSGTDPEKLQAKVDALVKQVSSKNTTPIQQLCREQFADRIELASCEVSNALPGDAGALTGIVNSRYYSASALHDDVYMRDCLKMKGRWEAAKRDDPKASRERMRQHATDAPKTADEAQRTLDGMHR